MTTRKLSAVAFLACFCLVTAGFTTALQAAMDPGPGGGDPPPPPPPSITVDDVQTFFHDSILDGTIEGHGRWFWAYFNLAMMDYALEQAALAFDNFDDEGAFRWLAYAYLRCNDTDWPTYDTVEGPAVPELKDKIKEVMALL